MIARELLPLLSRHFLERLGSGQRTSLLRVTLGGDGRFALAAAGTAETQHASLELLSETPVETLEAPGD